MHILHTNVHSTHTYPCICTHTLCTPRVHTPPTCTHTSNKGTALTSAVQPPTPLLNSCKAPAWTVEAGRDPSPHIPGSLEQRHQSPTTEGSPAPSTPPGPPGAAQTGLPDPGTSARHAGSSFMRAAESTWQRDLIKPTFISEQFPAEFQEVVSQTFPSYLPEMSLLGLSTCSNSLTDPSGFRVQLFSGDADLRRDKHRRVPPSRTSRTCAVPSRWASLPGSASTADGGAGAPPRAGLVLPGHLGWMFSSGLRRGAARSTSACGAYVCQ